LRPCASNLSDVVPVVRTGGTHPAMIPQLLVRASAAARRVGPWSSVAGMPLFTQAYYCYKRLCEGRQRALIGRLVRRGSLAVDVGANIGYFTIVMAEAAGEEGAVLAFEPDSENVRLLRAAVARTGLSNIQVIPAALSNRAGRAPLYVNPDHPGDHRIYPVGSHVKGQEVEIWSLDEYPVSQQFELSLVKIDVQGAESRVLSGMEKTLSAHPSAHVLLEFDPTLLRQADSDADTLVALTGDLGFHPFLLTKRGEVHASSWSDIKGVARDRYIDVLLSRQSVAALNQADGRSVYST